MALRSSARLRWIALLSLLLLVLGCRPAPLELDLPRIQAECDRRVSAAAASAEAEKAVDKLVSGAFADPAVGDAGKALLAALGAEPALKPGFDAIIAKIGGHPAMKQLILKLMREHPRESPERLGELASERVSAVAEGPLFDRAFNRAFNTLLARPEVEGAFRRLGEKVAADPHIGQAMRDTLQLHGIDDRWRDKLVALNGGKAVDKARATELFLDTAFSQQRCTRFYLDLTALPVMKREIAATARDMAATPAFMKHATEAIRACVDDPAFRDRAVEAMATMISGEVTEDKLYDAIRGLLDVPVVPRALTAMVDHLLADPSLAAIGERALAGLSADAAFRATVVQLVDGW